MILREIQNFLQQQGQASLNEIAKAVDAEPDAVRDMLVTLERKQRVHKLQLQAGCESSCNKCDAQNIEIYAWGRHPGNNIQTLSCPSH